MAKKTANLKIVQQKNDSINARRKEIETALGEVVDTIEKYFLVTPFDFIEGREAEGAYYLFSQKEKTPFNRFYEWNDVLMGKLFPEAHEAQRVLNEQGAGDAPGELAFAAQRFGFVVGVLVGMKALGASKEELLRRSEGFVYPAVERARIARSPMLRRQ